MLRVRDATLDDTEAIVSVTASGWQEGYQGIVPPQVLANLPLDRWRHEIDVGLRRPLGDAFTRVAELDGAIAGYAYVVAPAKDGDLQGEVAELVAMYVDPARWRQGVGTALMADVLERLGQGGYTDVVLWVFKENRAARKFYERHGFKRDRSERFHPLAQTQAMRMQMPVAGSPGAEGGPGTMAP